MSISTLRTGEQQDEFDPYLKWLGIEPHEHEPGKPPNHYRLLGINAYTKDLDVISNAADRQMAHVRTFQSGKYQDASQKILNQIAAAKLCLMDAAKKAAYDQKLANSGGVVSLRMGPQIQTILQVEKPRGPGIPVQLHDPVPPPMGRPLKRPAGNGSQGKGSGTANPSTSPEQPVPAPAPVPPPAKQPPMLEVLSTPKEEDAAPEWQFPKQNEQSGLSAYKRKREESWLEKHKATIIAGASGVALASAASLYAIFGGGGKPGQAETDRPVAKQPADDGRKEPIVKANFPPIEPEQPVEAQEVPAPPPPREVAINVPPVKVDIEAEAKRQAEEQRKKEEAAKQKFEADVARATGVARTKFLKVPTENLRSLAELEEDAVQKQAILNVLEEKIAEQQRQADFQADVEGMYKTMIAPDSPYQNVQISQILTAIRSEKDPKTRAALCVLAATQAGKTGSSSELHTALASINDSRFPSGKVLAMETNILEMHVKAPNKDMPPSNRLQMAQLALQQVSAAYVLEDYAMADRLCSAALEYVHGTSASNVRDMRERAAVVEKVRELRISINAARQEVATRSALHATHAAGLDLALEPKGPQESVHTAIYHIQARNDWRRAASYLEKGNDPLLAAAAKMDISVPLGGNADMQYKTAMAWKAAADANAAGNAATWYARAAEWLTKAERSNPTGKLKLDIAVLKKELGAKGIVTTSIETTNPETVAPKLPFPPGEAVDVLSKINPKKITTQGGGWKFSPDGKSIVGTSTEARSRIALPIKAKGNYTLDASFMTASDKGAAVFQLPVGDKMVQFVIEDGFSGWDQINGVRFHKNLALRNPTELGKNVPYNVQFTITLNGQNCELKAKLNGRNATVYAGPISALALPDGWETTSLGLGIASEKESVVFSNIRLTSEDGTIVPTE